MKSESVFASKVVDGIFGFASESGKCHSGDMEKKQV